MSEILDRLKQAAQDVIDAIALDDTGRLIGGKWIGGNGGLLSRETIAKSDALRRALSAMEGETE